MAKQTREYEITLDNQVWAKYKKLTNKGNCKCWLDANKIFALGIDTACSTNGVR